MNAGRPKEPSGDDSSGERADDRLEQGAEPERPADWAALLKHNWQKRALSESRDFYVASHPGWSQSQRWEAQARVDADIVCMGLDESWLRQAEVLEIGCGVGRLVSPLLDRTAAYSGFDIAAGMVEEARQRCRSFAQARFFESDGGTIPSAVRDRRYDLILAWAVFIHCPQKIIAQLAGEAFDLLAPGGHLRFQLLADPSDPTGIESSPQEAAAAEEEILAMEEGADEGDRSLIDDHYYMGHAFGYDEARQLFSSFGGALTLHRFDPGHIYGDLTNPPSAR